MDLSLERLVESAWSIYRRYQGQPFFLRDSIPVLFFGDLPRYRESRLKVVTVGLNPSREEFPRDHPFRRFSVMDKYFPFNGGSAAESFKRDYLQALNCYFSPATKYDWFDRSYEPVLNGMNCSYHSVGNGNRALHTDYCSPLATREDWGVLTDSQRMDLSRSGSDLWNELVRFLAPDVIIASIRKGLVDQIRRQFSSLAKPSLVTSISKRNDGSSRSHTYDVLRWDVTIDGRRGLLVYGKAAQRPFGSVSLSDRHEIGRRIVSGFLEAQV